MAESQSSGSSDSNQWTMPDCIRTVLEDEKSSNETLYAAVKEALDLENSVDLRQLLTTIILDCSSDDNETQSLARKFLLIIVGEKNRHALIRAFNPIISSHCCDKPAVYLKKRFPLGYRFLWVLLGRHFKVVKEALDAIIDDDGKPDMSAIEDFESSLNRKPFVVRITDVKYFGGFKADIGAGAMNRLETRKRKKRKAAEKKAESEAKRQKTDGIHIGDNAVVSGNVGVGSDAHALSVGAMNNSVSVDPNARSSDLAKTDAVMEARHATLVNDLRILESRVVQNPDDEEAKEQVASKKLDVEESSRQRCQFKTKAHERLLPLTGMGVPLKEESKEDYSSSSRDY